MPMFKRGADVAEYPEELRGFVTSHGWQAVDDAPAAPSPAPVAAPETPAVPTTAPADINTGVIND